MSESDSHSHDAERRLSARYGRARRPNRRHRLTIIVIAALALTAWVVWAGWSHSQPQIHGQLRAFEVLSAHQVKVRIAVFRPGTDAIACTVEALATDHSSVGEEVWHLQKGKSGTFPLTGTIETTRVATSADVVGCDAARSPPR